MYKIISRDSTQYVDSLVFIKVHPRNGCYVACEESEAEGICVKAPTEITNDIGTFVTCSDTVFAIKEGGLHGTETLCQFEQVDAALDFYNARVAAEQTYEVQQQLEELNNSYNEGVNSI